MNSIKISKGAAIVGIDMAVFSEGDLKVAYSPALDLAGQGKTVHDAISSLLETVKITLEWARENGTLHELLLNHGWTLTEVPTAIYNPPAFNAERIKKQLSIRQFETRKIQVPVYA